MERSMTLRRIVITALFAAMICVVTAYILHIPVGASGGYIHFGDALIFLAAVMLPKPYAIAAAAIGAGMADLLTAPIWVIPTLIIKTLIVLPFTSKHEKLLGRRNIIAAIVQIPISCGGYYLAEALIFGNWVAPAIDISLGLIQYVGSSVIFIIVALALDRVHVKKRIGEWNV